MSTDGGDNFTETTGLIRLNWWDQYESATSIAVDPDDENVILAGHNPLYRTANGGQTWDLLGGDKRSGVHVDIQAIVFDHTNHNHVYVATDGGVSESIDNGLTWKIKSYGLITTQCYHIGVSQDPNNLRYGITTQDNFCYQSNGSLSYDEISPYEGGFI